MSIFSDILNTLIPSRKRAIQYRITANRLESFLRAIPFEYCGWNADDIQAISTGFCALFDIPTLKTIEDLQDSLDNEDADTIGRLYKNLKHYGQEFETTLSLKGTKKTLKLIGKRGTLSDTPHIFNVIWVFDITEYTQKVHQALNSLHSLEHREDEFHQSLDTLPMPIWIRDEEHKLTWVNVPYASIINDTSEAIIEEQKELPLSPVKKIGKRGPKTLAQRAIAQNRIQTQSGFIVINGKRARVDVQEIPLPKGGTLGCAIDISRIEELESEMRHVQDSNYEVLEQLNTAIAVFDTDTNLEFYNAAYENLWALDGQWLNKRPKITEILDKLREGRKLPEQANFQQYKQDWLEHFTQLIDPHEEILYLPDGTMMRMILVPRPRGGLLTTFEDVTRKFELETSYNTLVAVQQETLNNLAEGIAVIGEDGCLKLFNPTFIKLWELNEDLVQTGDHVNDIFEHTKPLFEKQNWEDAKNKLIRMCFDRNGTSGRTTLKDKRIYAYRTIALPDGNVLVTYTDITNSVRVEQALIEKNTALEAAEKLKTDFLANVSYQLRTPLNAMMGFTEILHEEYFGTLNERQKGYTTNMIQAGHRLITLVDNILDLSTIEAGYMTLNLEDVSIKAAIESVADLTKDWARREGIEIEIKCPKNIGNIVADERRFKQALLHLIRNAIDYTPPSGSIKITTKKAKDLINITIQDTGVGIPKEDMSRIFKPFEKAGNNEKKPGPQNRHSGAGLGLSLVKHIVELHGGQIKIESEEGKGTTVSCSYPLSANQNQ